MGSAHSLALIVEGSRQRPDSRDLAILNLDDALNMGLEGSFQARRRATKALLDLAQQAIGALKPRGELAQILVVSLLQYIDSIVSLLAKLLKALLIHQKALSRDPLDSLHLGNHIGQLACQLSILGW